MGKNFCWYSSDRQLISRIHKKVKEKLTPPKQMTQSKKMKNELNGQFSKVEMPNKYMKKCLSHLATREI